MNAMIGYYQAEIDDAIEGLQALRPEDVSGRVLLDVFCLHESCLEPSQVARAAENLALQKTAPINDRVAQVMLVKVVTPRNIERFRLAARSLKEIGQAARFPYHLPSKLNGVSAQDTLRNIYDRGRRRLAWGIRQMMKARGDTIMSTTGHKLQLM